MRNFTPAKISCSHLRRSFGNDSSRQNLPHGPDTQLQGIVFGETTAALPPPMPRHLGRELLAFVRFAGKIESRRADSNRLPLLITSDHSRVAGVCRGLQNSHI